MGAFGKIRHTTIKGEKGTDWYVELWKEGHTAASIDMTLAGEGFTITWNGEGSTRNRNFLGSECVLNLFIENDTDEDLLYDILSRGFRKYFIRIYKNSTNASDIWWYGWIAPAFDTIENAPYPYQSSITATDSYGYYSQRPIDRFEDDGSDSYNVVMDRNHSVADICTDFIKNMELFTTSETDNHPIPSGIDFLSIAITWTLAADATTTNPPPTERYFISKAPFVTSDNFPREYKESDVFKDVLKIFNLTGMLAEGKYHFFQPNTYLNNASSQNTFFNYDDLSSPAVFDNFTNPTTNITIDQTNNVLLGGSSFTYEAPLKSATASFSYLGVAGSLAEDTELNIDSYMSAGQLFSDNNYKLRFDMTHTIEVNMTTNTLDWDTGSNPINYTNAMRFGNALALTIKATHGTTTKWLGYAGTNTYPYNELEWQNSETRIVVHRNYHDKDSPSTTPNYYGYTLAPDWREPWDAFTCFGSKKNTTNLDGPCRMSTPYVQKDENMGWVEYKTDFIFDADIPPLDNDSDISIKIIEPDLNLYQVYDSSEIREMLIINRDINTRNSKAVINEFTFNKDDAFSTEASLEVYKTEQSLNTAIEQQDLGNVTVGQTNIDPKFSIRDSNKASIILPFQVGTDTTTSQNITRLLTDQFLEMQITPLQILQGSIQSANISPLQVIKYKLNSDDADFGYYMFLGGTFKANSEIMDGEWFKLKKD